MTWTVPICLLSCFVLTIEAYRLAEPGDPYSSQSRLKKYENLAPDYQMTRPSYREVNTDILKQIISLLQDVGRRR